MDELPDRAELTAQAREMASHVTKLREAPMLERYNGPVLFEGAAAAEVFSQVFASNLLGQRVPVAGDSRFQAEENPFLDKLGARVLPRFLSVVDDSTVTEYEGTPLLASYKADDEGTPSRRTELVENGMLQTLLTGRNPVRGIDGSTGNLRGSGPMPSCVFISAAEGLDRAALRARFIDEIVQRRKEYGVVVRRLGGSAVRAAAGRGRRGRGGGSRARNGAGIVAAYKLYPDGREELIRNAQFSDFAAAAFRDIIAVSRERTVHQAVFRAQGGSRFGRGGGGGARLVSWVVPDMLFEDLTLTRPRGEVRLPPVLKHPFFEGAAR